MSARKALRLAVKHRVRSFVWRHFHLSHRLPDGGTVHIRSGADWHVYDEIFAGGEYDQAIRLAYECRSNVGPLTVLDLGANVGFFTARVRDVMGRSGGGGLRAVLIEGSPRVFAELETRLQDLPDGCQVRAVHGLVGERSGVASIQEVEFHPRNTMLAGHNKGRSWVKVPYVDVEEVAGPGPIDLLKCDVEGSEESFLANYPKLLRRTHLVVVELHAELCDTQRCRDLLEDAGLRSHSVLSGDSKTSVELFWRPDDSVSEGERSTAR